MFHSKKHTALFFLIFFISIKLVGLHELTHHCDNDIHDDCDICEFVIVSNTTPFIAYEHISFEQEIQHNNYKAVFYKYTSQFIQCQIDNNLFCRPPPTI